MSQSLLHHRIRCSAGEGHVTIMCQHTARTCLLWQARPCLAPAGTVCGASGVKRHTACCQMAAQCYSKLVDRSSVCLCSRDSSRSTRSCVCGRGRLQQGAQWPGVEGHPGGHRTLPRLGRRDQVLGGTAGFDVWLTGFNALQTTALPHLWFNAVRISTSHSTITRRVLGREAMCGQDRLSPAAQPCTLEAA